MPWAFIFEFYFLFLKISLFAFLKFFIFLKANYMTSGVVMLKKSKPFPGSKYLLKWYIIKSAITLIFYTPSQ